MRSSKSRSRSKSGRSRSVGNIVNRVFDSSGPEGKVRGTPQQIIDKYNQLARDATLGNDRVAAENFQQHAEHYTRMLAEAQRELEARREQQDRERGERREQQEQARGDDGDTRGESGEGRDRSSEPQPDVLSEVMDVGGESDSGLVETPESRSSKPQGRRQRRPRGGESGGGKTEDSGAAEAAE